MCHPLSVETVGGKQNLNCANVEDIFELSNTEISRNKDAQGFDENRDAAQAGGDIAGNARKELESKSGRSVISKDNYLSLESSELKIGTSQEKK